MLMCPSAILSRGALEFIMLFCSFPLPRRLLKRCVYVSAAWKCLRGSAAIFLVVFYFFSARFNSFVHPPPGCVMNCVVLVSTYACAAGFFFLFLASSSSLAIGLAADRRISFSLPPFSFSCLTLARSDTVDSIASDVAVSEWPHSFPSDISCSDSFSSEVRSSVSCSRRARCAEQ